MTQNTMPYAPKSKPHLVFLGVTASCVLCAVPFFFKSVRDREQQVAELRDAQYEAMDAKAAARNQRLSLSGRN
uniref:Transmembrane protein n=1 Tax=Tetraselmis sp. GSL018 TaxID=582737 RepID=A0A061QZC5_9CHLO